MFANSAASMMRIKFKSKERSLTLQENRTYTGNINLQKKLIDDTRKSARKNVSDVSKSTFVCKKKTDIIINGIYFLKEKNDLLKRVIAEMRIKMQVCLQGNRRHIE